MRVIIGIPFDNRCVCRSCGDSWIATHERNYENEIIYLSSCADCKDGTQENNNLN